MSDGHLRCATWNVHRAKGRDGRIDPTRVVDAIGTELGPLGLDVLALQEADGECRPHARILDVGKITTRTGLRSVHDTGSQWGPESDGFLGTILFLAPSLPHDNVDVIDLPGHCHRGAVSVETRIGQRAVRIISTHLSLWQPLRIVQMRILGQYLRRRPKMQTVLLGDLNEWRPWGGLMLHPRLVGADMRGPSRRTFPSAFPALPLDRILTDAPGNVRDLRALATPQIIAASDHLALAGVVTVP